MQCTPEDKSPISTVPKPAENEDDQDINPPARRIHSFSTQGHIKIISKPGGEGNVPTSPEIRDGAGEIREVKVLHKIKT